MLKKQLPAALETTLLTALQRAYEDGFRYCYLSVPREGVYHKFLNQIKTCGRIIATDETGSWADLNHALWCYSSKNGIIRSGANANAALILFKPNDSEDHSISNLTKGSNLYSD